MFHKINEISRDATDVIRFEKVKRINALEKYNINPLMIQ